MIISGGMNIYPAEIEAALEQHPDIYDVAVFGIPSEEWGEAVHAVVVRGRRDARPSAEVIAFAREHLAGYKMPALDRVPRRAAHDRLRARSSSATSAPPYWAGRTSQVG